jgi:hypothetical protein
MNCVASISLSKPIRSIRSIVAAARGSGGGRSREEHSLARKYCFKASCTLIESERPLGIFIAYDYRISVVQDVKNACVTHAGSLHPGVSCGEVELTMMDECAVEVTDDIYFYFLRDKDGNEADDES